MTTFKDRLRDIHLESKTAEDFDTWCKNLSRKDFANYFSSYIDGMSNVNLSRVAEVVYDNQ